MIRNTIIGLVALTALLLTTTVADAHRGRRYSHRPIRTVVVVKQAPRPALCRAQATWVAGDWTWCGPRIGYRWVPGHWMYRRG